MRKMKLSKIKIRKDFLETMPSEEKMIECREFWRYEGKQDRPIVINNKGVLVDGYVMYCVLKEHKEEYAMVRKLKKPAYRNKTTTYVYGTHPNSKDIKTYMWRVPETWTNWADNVQIGDTVMCATKFGYAPVVVSKIEILDKCPIDIPVKKVCNKQIRRNGIIVEI